MSKILVKSKRDSFWRSGIRFTRAGVEIDTAKISKAKLDAIESEPNLVVASVAEKPKKSEKTDPDPAGADAPESEKKVAKPAKGKK